MTLNYQARLDTNAVVRLTDYAIIGPEKPQDWQEYIDWRAEGNTPLPPDPIPKFVPSQVPMWSVRVVLKRSNLFDQAQAAIDASTDDAIKVAWEYGNFASRDSAAIAALATELGLTSDNVDDLFIEANSLNI